MAGNGHHHADMWVFPRAETATQDVVARTLVRPGGVTVALVISAVLVALGVIGFIVRAAGGFGVHGAWGYHVAIFSFIFMVTGAAPLVAAAFRFTKSHWRRPISRISELFAVVGVVNILLFIPAMLALPPISNPSSVIEPTQTELRRTIWFQVPIGAPHWWDLLGLIFLAICGLGILWLSIMPDLADARLHCAGLRQKIYGMLAGRWYGTKRQWTIQKAGLALLGAWYFMLLVFVQFIISSDYAMSMVPGWKDSIFPAIYTVMGFQSSLGLILVIAYILRKWGGYQEYIGVAQFWSASKILLGLTLLWAYHMFAFFITFWYGRLVVEQNIIKYLLFQSYLEMFLANLLFSFALPFAILIWNPVRKSAGGPALAGLLAVIGAFLYNIRIFVGAFNAAPGDHLFDLFLESVPPATGPAIWDIFIVLGGLGLAALVYLGATRLIPVISLWEIKEGAMYQRMDTLIRGRYLVLAKPE